MDSTGFPTFSFLVDLTISYVGLNLKKKKSLKLVKRGSNNRFSLYTVLPMAFGFTMAQTASC